MLKTLLVLSLLLLPLPVLQLLVVQLIIEFTVDENYFNGTWAFYPTRAFSLTYINTILLVDLT